MRAPTAALCALCIGVASYYIAVSVFADNSGATVRHGPPQLDSVLYESHEPRSKARWRSVARGSRPERSPGYLESPDPQLSNALKPWQAAALADYAGFSSTYMDVQDALLDQYRVREDDIRVCLDSADGGRDERNVVIRAHTESSRSRLSVTEISLVELPLMKQLPNNIAECFRGVFSPLTLEPNDAQEFLEDFQDILEIPL